MGCDQERNPPRARRQAARRQLLRMLAAYRNLAISILRMLGHENIPRDMEEMSRHQALALAVR